MDLAALPVDAVKVGQRHPGDVGVHQRRHALGALDDVIDEDRMVGQPRRRIALPHDGNRMARNELANEARQRERGFARHPDDRVGVRHHPGRHLVGLIAGIPEDVGACRRDAPAQRGGHVSPAVDHQDRPPVDGRLHARRMIGPGFGGRDVAARLWVQSTVLPRERGGRPASMDGVSPATYFTIDQILPSLQKAGEELRGPCPAHGGTRAFYLRPLPVDGTQPDPTRPATWHGLFNCFSCGYRGKLHSGVLVQSGDAVPEGVVVRSEVLAACPAEDALVPEEVSDALAAAFALTQELYPRSEAEAYVERRCLEPLAGAGYVPDESFRFPSSVDVEFLARVGMALPDGRVRPNWARRLVLPYSWIDETGRGRLTTLYGRSVCPPAQRRENHFYTRGHLDPDEEAWAGSRRWVDLRTRWFRGLYNPRAAVQREVRIVEGALDAVAAAKLGMENVCALGGTNNACLLRPRALQAAATVWWSLDRDRKWALERDPSSTDPAVRTLPRLSIYHRYRDALGDRLVVDLPPPLRMPDGSITKDWADVCTVVFGGRRAAPPPSPERQVAVARTPVTGRPTADDQAVTRARATQHAADTTSRVDLSKLDLPQLLDLPPDVLLESIAPASPPPGSHLDSRSG
jgi:hypothetical protein